MKISKQNILIAMANAETNITKLAARIGMKPQNLSAILSRGSCRPETVKKLRMAWVSMSRKSVRRNEKMKIDPVKLQTVIVGRMLNITSLAKLMGVRTHVLRSVLERESCTAAMACKIAEALEVDVEEITKGR